MKPIHIALLTFLALGLAGCGNKGALVLPGAPVDDAPAVEAPPTAEPTPEALNAADPQPPQGEGSEGGDAATPPVKPPR